MGKPAFACHPELVTRLLYKRELSKGAARRPGKAIRVKSAPADQFRTSDGEMRPQCAALCWRMVKGRLRILLVTSRETGRWVIPKGWPITGLGDAASAAREAWEEAGVRGEVSDTPVGCFAYDKVLNRDAARPSLVPCMVTVHALRVETLADKYPEAGQRERCWCSPRKAARRVDEPGLSALIAGFAATLADAGAD